MTLEAPPRVRSARWASRIALFSICLLLVALVLHRFLSLPTPLALNLFRVALTGAVIALLIGVAALIRIWFTGDAGAGSAAAGVMLALLALGGPLVHAASHYRNPHINDVTTDLVNPPAFVALARRPPGANSPVYPGPRFASLQAKAFPDLTTMVLDRPAEETFELVEEAVRRLYWTIVTEVPPTEAAPGLIEATERTLFVGFPDDIVIRVAADAGGARVDARSASRYGSFDFGTNAERLRRLFAEIRARAEVTPSAATARKRRGGK